MKTQLTAAIAASALGTFAAFGVASAAEGEHLHMQQKCTGEAAGLYNVKPVYVTLGPVFQATDGWSIEGEVDLGTEGKRHFNCIFTPDKKFSEVMPLESDGE